MNKEMIISSGDHETRVAILEDDQVVEVFIERENQRGVVGNVYKGRVSKVLPGMQSSFVDIGLERDAFLYVSEVVNTVEEFERLESGDDETTSRPCAVASPSVPPRGGAGGEQPRPRRADGRQDAAAATAAVTAAGDARAARRPRRPQAKIEDLLKEGQEVLVQVVKEPLGTKGARLTSHVTMPGRFLVFMPTVDHVGVSRKIESREERGAPARHRPRIPRTARLHRRRDHPDRRRRALEGRHRQRPDVLPPGLDRDPPEDGSAAAPAVLFQEQSLVTKLLRDLLTDDYTAIRIDNEQEYRRVMALVERIMPNLLPRVKLYTKDFPIFEEYGVQAEIDKALRSKVWLKSGGYLVINQTEALVAIDVNTGRYVGKRTGRLEDTIVKTNLEAVKEIVRQLRLRDLGGIIVLDLIDMEEKKNRQKVFQEVEKELRKDRSPSKALQVSDFGLVIVTRKRVKQSLERQLTEPCPYCSGSGSIKSSSTICYEILTEMKKIGQELDGQGVILRVNPDIAQHGALLFLQRTRDVRVDPQDHALPVEFRADLLQLGQDLVADRRARLDRPRARAVRTRLGQLALEALLHALARDDDQPEVRDLHRLRRRAILAQLLLDLLEDLLPVLLLLHVDEVEHDDAAEIAQAQLADDLLHRFEVGLDDRVLEPAGRLADVAAGIDVDRDQRLGLVDDDVAARLQPDLAAQRLVDLAPGRRTPRGSDSPSCRASRAAAGSA